MNDLINVWMYLLSGYIRPLNALLELLLGRILYASVILSFLVGLIMFARKNLKPTIRSWIWALCVPALFIPFEHGIVSLARTFYTPPDFIPSDFPLAVWELVNALPPYLWLSGVAIYAAKTQKNNNCTMRMLQTGQLRGCAAYFYKCGSHIYLPPDFETAYTSTEREMLLAHENQHIIQHDPILYRFLQTIQCVFWFNPLVHIAVRLIRQDRELLCDWHMAYGHSKHEYGMLLLREAKKNSIGHMMPGIVSEAGGVYERVTACVKPFSENSKPAVIVAGIAAVMFAVGSMGFVKPIVNTQRDVHIVIEHDGVFSRLESAERFIILKPDGVAIDQQGLFEHAVSIGLDYEQELDVIIIKAERLTLIGNWTQSSGGIFTIKELKTEDIFFPYSHGGWDMMFRLL